MPDYSGLVRIAARDISRITAERDYMRLHVGQRSWLIHRTIAKLEEELDPAMFIRVHRSVMLRRDTIAGLYRDDGGHWTARLSRRRRATDRPLLCRRREAAGRALSLATWKGRRVGLHHRLPMEQRRLVGSVGRRRSSLVNGAARAGGCGDIPPFRRPPPP